MEVVISGSAHPALGSAIAEELGVPCAPAYVGRFPDGEIRVGIEGDAVRGREAVIVQPTGLPVSDNIIELLLLADACRRGGAVRVEAVVPYFGYARHDRRVRGGEPIGARIVSDLLASAHIERVLAVDLHTSALEGFFSMPIEHLSAVPQLAEAVRPHVGSASVVVSPDLGAVQLAEVYAERLGLPMAIVHKTRTSGTEVSVRGIVGNVQGLRPLVVDDMISTGGTIEAAIAAMLERGCVPDVIVVASHGVFVGRAGERLKDLPIARIVTTDSVPLRADAGVQCEIVPLAPQIAEALWQLRHHGPRGFLHSTAA